MHHAARLTKLIRYIEYVMVLCAVYHYRSLAWLEVHVFSHYLGWCRCKKYALLLTPQLFVKSSNLNVLDLMEQLDKPILLVPEQFESNLGRRRKSSGT